MPTSKTKRVRRVNDESYWEELNWDHIPEFGELIEDIMENTGGGITFEFGGESTYWIVVRNRERKAIVPVQVAEDLTTATKLLWIELFTKKQPPLIKKK